MDKTHVECGGGIVRNGISPRLSKKAGWVQLLKCCVISVRAMMTAFSRYHGSDIVNAQRLYHYDK